MLSIVWLVIMVISFIYAFVGGNIEVCADALFESSESCISFILEIGAYMIMWSGFMRVANDSKLTDKLANIMSPVIRRIFRGVKKGSEEARLICSNLAANMLGLSNAATPLGMSAMKKLSEKSINSTATNNMCMLAVINCASLQLIPSTLIAMRSGYGSTAPGSITIPIWIASLTTLIFAIMITKLCEGRDIRG
ncbi:MAG: spore maturation protein A [Clostridia bacterium]|nr:spore maturation protein A [Clostridia bacterium]